MVLESILDPKKAEDDPLEIFLVSVIFSLIALWLSYNLFPSQSSILSIALVTIFFVPFFQRLFILEESKDEIVRRGQPRENFLKRHRKVIYAFSAFFIGTMIVFSFTFTFIPETRETFTLQLDWFRAQGMMITSENPMEVYLLNNTQVLGLFFILSVLFGAGAVFILTWNASVIAVFLGIAANKLSPTLGAPTAYLYGVTTGLASIALHGIPEILGYFFAGIAGGILSVGLIREKFMSKEFKEVLKDSFVWLAIGEMLIILGAWLEAVF